MVSSASQIDVKANSLQTHRSTASTSAAATAQNTTSSIRAALERASIQLPPLFIKICNDVAHQHLIPCLDDT